MIIVSINGGLGNQLFQYAFGKHLEYLHQEEVLFDLSVFENPAHREFALNHFNVTIKKAEQRQLPFHTRKAFRRLGLISKILNKIIYPLQLVTQKQFDFDISYQEKGKNTYYWGYWQSEKYFYGVKEMIKQHFSFKQENFSAQEKAIFQKIKTTNSICLHVRRGDYIGNNLHPLCDISYYQKAINLITEKVENPYFFVFSDDISWCKSNLNILLEHEFVQTEEAWKDLLLMTYCKHNIIANSSFSWWGAYLGKHEEKIVISPNDWFAREYQYDIKDLKPSNWISI